MKNYKFHYNLIGDKDQPVILFLHGFLGNCHDFAQIIPFLTAHFCCLTVDLPGHGQTIVTNEDIYYTMSYTAEAIINLLDFLQIKKCFLIGYSMGGRLGLYLTLYFPERFNKVMLESASPGLKNEAEKLTRMTNDLKIAQQLETTDFTEFLNNWYNQPLFTSLKQHINFDELITNRLNNEPIKLAKSLRNLSIGYQPSLWEKLPENHIPLLLIVGEYDQKFININSEMVKLCPYSQMSIVNKTGHNIHWENSHKFMELIKYFFGN
ncbi:MAG TPA: 2-succinyl-6-hydroxy-2,4-cyclohexadiene-1-carboxylate synthase [Allocoleopsis sp.]